MENVNESKNYTRIVNEYLRGRGLRVFCVKEGKVIKVKTELLQKEPYIKEVVYENNRWYLKLYNDIETGAVGCKALQKDIERMMYAIKYLNSANIETLKKNYAASLSSGNARKLMVLSMINRK